MKTWLEVWESMQFDPSDVGKTHRGWDFGSGESWTGRTWVMTCPITGRLLTVTEEDQKRYKERFESLPLPVAVTLDPLGEFPRWWQGSCQTCEHTPEDEGENPFILKCPGCSRLGCHNCMPMGRGCICPECEDRRHARRK